MLKNLPANSGESRLPPKSAEQRLHQEYLNLAFHRGRRECREGRLLRDNRYPEDSLAGRMWLEGWRSMDIELNPPSHDTIEFYDLKA